MRLLAILCFALFSQLVEAQISEGMSKTLPADHLEKNHYLEFENFRDSPRAPIAAAIKIDGQPVRSIQEIFRYFSEIVGAWLPEGKTIKSKTDSEGREVWNYPIGTRVIHFLTLNDKEKTPFELRMMERVEEGRWAFGVYHLKEGEYKLQNYNGLLQKEFELNHENGKVYNVSLKHIPLQVCQNCHSNTTSAPYQYSSRQDVGPCEFTPANPKVKNDWVKKFLDERGYHPIQKL
ncbi:MAG: hypothetical protein EP326_04430 [Deltaproteobacteria bacterium]|nr:MAG: hypothetical protein EP326_04430 [Deltaproteobacteria bacterium]TNF25901.1 MAG: hypothetical protein EP319_15140 [Deltaproteobacteria bacterium]